MKPERVHSPAVADPATSAAPATAARSGQPSSAWTRVSVSDAYELTCFCD
jgi:hypothetical protein